MELPWWVCDDEQGAVAGYVCASQHRELPAYPWSVDITAYVREDCRGQGVGKRLYPVLFTELSALGDCQAFACIALPNDVSVALHESVGFLPIAGYREVGVKLGAWHDVGWWQKQLRETAQPALPRAFQAQPRLIDRSEGHRQVQPRSSATSGSSMRAGVMRMDVAACRIALFWTTPQPAAESVRGRGFVAHTPRSSH